MGSGYSDTIPTLRYIIQIKSSILGLVPGNSVCDYSQENMVGIVIKKLKLELSDSQILILNMSWTCPARTPVTLIDNSWICNIPSIKLICST